MASNSVPARPAQLSPLAQAFVAAAAAGTKLVFVAPPPPPPMPVPEAAALGAAVAGLLPLVEGDLEQWLAVVETGRRAVLRIAACDDQRQRGGVDLSAAVGLVRADLEAWEGALSAIKPGIEGRQKGARAALAQIDRFEAIVRANEDMLRKRTKLKVMRELQAGQRALAGFDDGAASARAASAASGEAADALARVRAARPNAIDPAQAGALQARAKGAIVADDARPAGAADPSVVNARAQALWEATRADIDGLLGRMRRLLGLEGEALRRQAALQQLSLQAHGHAVSALGLVADAGNRARSHHESEFAFAFAGMAEAGRAAGGATAAYDSTTASAGYAEALGAAASAVSAALARIGA